MMSALLRLEHDARKLTQGYQPTAGHGDNIQVGPGVEALSCPESVNRVVGLYKALTYSIQSSAIFELIISSHTANVDIQ